MFAHDFSADFPECGAKVLFDGAHRFPVGGASFTEGGEGLDEIDAVVGILFQHQDTEGKNTIARKTGTAAIILHLRRSKGIPALEITSSLLYYGMIDGLVLGGLVLVGALALGAVDRDSSVGKPGYYPTLFS